MAGEEPYPRKILQYMEGFLVSKALFSACELGVFERLQGSQWSASDLALSLGCSEDGMERLLNTCVSLELLTARTDPHGAVVYSNTEMSSMFLLKSSPRSLCQSIEYSSRTIYLCWHYLSDAVREGRNQYEKAFGVDSRDLFEAMYRSDEEMVKFMHLMNSVWNICGRDVITAFDLSPFRCICDLGGCSGALAKQCVSAFPQSTVTIFDLPKVVRTSQQHFVCNQDERICFCEEAEFLKDLHAALKLIVHSCHDPEKSKESHKASEQSFIPNTNLYDISKIHSKWIM
ncbi:acetylserotonin O-methyltransferase isoform X3 [Carassius auratus]|uniref:Acetylserotonin O-methyltransferase isoform X3 n=1 Tax=Carassius auratus TaxID=7957 RepID=A0A6P6Q671_CARAU|nr:acetylserotonin O-methyltransferase isoform X3 [Carassius auratus]